MPKENPNIPDRSKIPVAPVGAFWDEFNGGKQVFGVDSLSLNPAEPEVVFKSLVVKAVDDEEVEYDEKVQPWERQLFNKELFYQAYITTTILDSSVVPGKPNAHLSLRTEHQELTFENKPLSFVGNAKNVLKRAKSIYEQQETMKRDTIEKQVETFRTALDEEDTLALFSSKEGEYADKMGQEVENEEQFLWFTREVLKRDGYAADRLPASELMFKQQQIRDQIKQAQHQWENAIDEKTARFLDKKPEIPVTEKELQISQERAEDYILDVVSEITGSLVTDVSEIGNAYYTAILEDRSDVGRKLEQWMKKDRNLDMRDALSDINAYKIGSVGTNPEQLRLIEEKRRYEEEIQKTTEVFLETMDEEVTEENIVLFRDKIIQEREELEGNLYGILQGLIVDYLQTDGEITYEEAKELIESRYIKRMSDILDEEVIDLSDMTTGIHIAILVDEEGFQENFERFRKKEKKAHKKAKKQEKNKQQPKPNEQGEGIMVFGADAEVVAEQQVAERPLGVSSVEFGDNENSVPIDEVSFDEPDTGDGREHLL